MLSASVNKTFPSFIVKNKWTKGLAMLPPMLVSVKVVTQINFNTKQRKNMGPLHFVYLSVSVRNVVIQGRICV